jgi:hypothetical protein
MGCVYKDSARLAPYALSTWVNLEDNLRWEQHVSYYYRWDQEMRMPASAVEAPGGHNGVPQVGGLDLSSPGSRCTLEFPHALGTAA